MNWVSMTALFFVVWWLVLFVILPIGLKTQDEDGDVTLGTVSSAPRGPHVLRAALWTTLVTAMIIGGFYGLTTGWGMASTTFRASCPTSSKA